MLHRPIVWRAVLTTALAGLVALPSPALADPTSEPTPTPAGSPSTTATPAPPTPTASPPASQPPGPAATTTPSSASGRWDLAAIGTTVRAVGVDRTTLRIGVRNVGTGPLLLPPDSADYHPVMAYVYLPGNAFGLHVTYDCAGWGAGPDGWDWLDPGRPSSSYACLNSRLLPGETYWIVMTVTVYKDRSPYPAGYIQSAPVSGGKNDIAKILILTKADPPAPGSGGQLPATGDRTGAVAALGVGAVALGAVLVVLATTRRRWGRPRPGHRPPASPTG